MQVTKPRQTTPPLRPDELTALIAQFDEAKDGPKDRLEESLISPQRGAGDHRRRMPGNTTPEAWKRKFLGIAESETRYPIVQATATSYVAGASRRRYLVEAL